MELRRLLSRAALALALLGGSLGIDGAIAEAEAAAKKSASASAKKTKAKKKKASAKKAASAGAKPVLRASSGPTEVGDEEAEGEPGEEEAEGGSPESELAAIEAEILAEIAAGRLPPDAPLDAAVEAEVEPVDDAPRWVTHTVIAGETVDGVAARYGVPAKSLVRWNKLDAKTKALRSGRDLRVHAVRPPPPRVETSVEVKKGDSWEKIAAAHGVSEKELRLWNRPKKAKGGAATKATLKAGQRLTLWVEPEGAEAATSGAPRLLASRVRANAFSIGSPTRGRLVNGVELPELPELYTRRAPEKSYGSSHTVRTLILSIAQFRKQARYDGPVVIGAISLPRGGRFRPHRSHQSGRDVDIRLPTLPSVQHNGPPSVGEIDWTATWRLLESFIKTGQVQYIFLDYGLQKRLYKAARAAGVSKAALAEVLQWPRDSRSNNGIVRHSPGHRSHFHVRVKCGQSESKCDAGR